MDSETKRSSLLSLLIRKQMMEIFRSYFYDAKNNKKRSKAGTAGFILLYAVIMVGMLGGIFTYLAISLRPMIRVGMGWFVFLIMGAIGALLGTFGSVFNTFTGLYLSKDNDLLLSMPIPVKDIILARLSGVYLMGLMYSGVVTVPCAVVCLVTAGVTLRGLVGALLFVMLISLGVLLLSCLLGFCVAKLSRKLKNKSFITVLLALGFIAVYYVAYFKANELIQRLIQNAVLYGDVVRDAAYPLYLCGRAGEGAILPMLTVTAGMAILTGLTWLLLRSTFLHIATSSASAGNAAAKTREVSQKTPFAALFGKEMGRFTSSPNYMLNCGIGLIFLPAAAVFLLIKSGFGRLALPAGSGLGEAIIAVIFVGALCMLCSTVDITAPSVSLEGKTLWILKTLPVDPLDVLKAKLMVQISVLTPPLALLLIVCVCVLPCSMPVILLCTLIGIVLVPLYALFGLFAGLLLPNLSWSNEIYPIKQGGAVAIALFGGWGFAILNAAPYLILRFALHLDVNILLYLSCILVITLILTVLLWIWMKKKGAAILAAL